MKTKLFILVSITLLSALLVVMIKLHADHSRPDRNGFARTFVAELLTDVSIPLAGNHHYFAGVSGKTIWLGNARQPLQLIEVSRTGGMPRQHLITVPYPVRASRIMVDSASYYLGDLTEYKIYKGSLYDWSLTDPAYEGTFFSEFMPVGDSAMVMRTILNGEFELIKKNARGFTVENRDALQKQLDGLFCVDGALRYDPQLHRLVYVYFHRNEFISLDTTLQVLFRGRTVDTTRLAKMRVGVFSSGQASSLASPAFLVNRKVVVADSVLYINSLLRADNESKTKWEDASVIDMYSLNDGTYLGSFYLPYYRGKRFRHFTVYGDKLLALFDDQLFLYSWRQSIP